jgi:N utilization substance protein A
MNTELMEALTILEKEKNISRDTMMDAIENSLISACKNHFGTSDNIKVIMNRETCDYAVYAEKEVVEEVFDPAIEITLEDAEEIDSALQIGDVCQVPVQSKEFGRIATMNAKNLILQKIREEERKVVYDQYFEKEKDIVLQFTSKLPKNKYGVLHTEFTNRAKSAPSLVVIEKKFK